MVCKWDLWLADLNPRRGTQPGKTRPVLVVQTDLVDLEMEDIIHIVLQMDLTDFQTLEI